MECDNRFYLYTGHKFLCTISSTSVTIKKSPLSNFRIVSEQGRTKDLKTQNWQLYKSPERASAVSTNIWGDQPSRRSGLGFIMFGSEAWVPVTSLCVWKSISCLLSLIPGICLSFISCSSSVQHQESLGLFGLIVHSTACLPIYSSNLDFYQISSNFRFCTHVCTCLGHHPPGAAITPHNRLAYPSPTSWPCATPIPLSHHPGRPQGRFSRAHTHMRT